MIGRTLRRRAAAAPIRLRYTVLRSDVWCNELGPPGTSLHVMADYYFSWAGVSKLARLTEFQSGLRTHAITSTVRQPSTTETDGAASSARAQPLESLQRNPSLNFPSWLLDPKKEPAAARDKGKES